MTNGPDRRGTTSRARRSRIAFATLAVTLLVALAALTPQCSSSGTSPSSAPTGVAPSVTSTSAIPSPVSTGTAGSSTSTTTLLVWGDCRPPDEGQTQISDGFAHVAPRLAAAHADGNLALGDYVNPGPTDSTSAINAMYDAFFAAYRRVTTPTIWVVGNHEVVSDAGRAAYTQHMHVPDYYVTSDGPIHVIVASTVEHGFYAHIGFYGEGDSRNSPQADWLVTQLKRLAQTDPGGWVVVAEHHPIADPYVDDPYHDSAEQKATEALFAKYGVDLVVNGDYHSYRRHEQPGNPIYLTQGTAGAPPYSVSRVPLDPFDAKAVSHVFGYTLFTLDAKGLHGVTYEADPSDWAFKPIDSFAVPNLTAQGG
jgi:Calcineurin-like phosphoesterase